MDELVNMNIMIEPIKKRMLRIEAAKRNQNLSELLREIIDEKLSDDSFFTEVPHRATQFAHGNERS